MHPAVVFLAVALVVVVVVILRSRSADRSPAAIQEAATRKPSIYQQIRDQLRASPDEPLRVENIRTDDPAVDGAVRFAPGASDALFGGAEESTAWKEVLDVIGGCSRGKDLDWTAVDAVTAGVPTASNVDPLLDQLRASDLTPKVKERFWEVALKSRRTESVKWGIAIGGIGLQPDEVEPLVTLAHHAEFTLFAAHVLMREGTKEPRYRRRLVDLLPRVRQWGVIRLIDYIVRCDDLIADAHVQRDVILYGMENNDGIPMEVAFTIAKSVDVRRFIAASREDDRLRRAVAALMDTLLTQPEPLGGLVDLEGWETIYDAWVGFLEQRAADVTDLGALRGVRLFLSDSLEWSRTGQERDRIDRQWKAKFSADALRKGLDDVRDRWLALQIIHEQEGRELLPDVRRAHASNADHATIRVLAKLGSREDLEALRVSIGKLVDLEARERIPLSMRNVFGPEQKHSAEYAEIVRAMARLATPGAVLAIKRALSDFDPRIRAAGCDAVAKLGGDLIDDEIRAAVRARLKDEPLYVAKSARSAADAHGIQDP